MKSVKIACIRFKLKPNQCENSIYIQTIECEVISSTNKNLFKIHYPQIKRGIEGDETIAQEQVYTLNKKIELINKRATTLFNSFDKIIVLTTSDLSYLKEYALKDSVEIILAE
jgi:hypothetical protein